MKKLITLTVVLALLGISISCNNNQVKLMPITSASDEAVNLYREAYIDWQSKDIASCDLKMRKALDLDPNFFLGNLFVSDLHLALGKDTALSDMFYEKAMQSKLPLNIEEELIKKIYVNLRKNNSYDYGEEIKSLYLEYPQDICLISDYALYLEFSQKFSEEVDVINKAIEELDYDAIMYNRLGYALMGLKKFDDADNAFDKYLELEPDQANPYDSKGDFFRASNQYNKAIEYYQKAISKDLLYGNWVKTSKIDNLKRTIAEVSE